MIEGAHCQFIQIWPVDVHQLPQWINQRLQQAGLSAQRDAVDLIAARVEGNLLAAAQEIEKLKLLADGNPITVETVQAAVADSARFDVFGLVDAILNGEAAHALRMLEGLRGEGVEPPVILWPWLASCANWPGWPNSSARGCRWTRHSARPARRSGTNADRWSAKPCNACRRDAGHSCCRMPSVSMRRSRARPRARPGRVLRACRC